MGSSRIPRGTGSGTAGQILLKALLFWEPEPTECPPSLLSQQSLQQRLSLVGEKMPELKPWCPGKPWLCLLENMQP